MDSRDKQDFYPPMVVEQPPAEGTALAPVQPRRGGFLGFLMRLLGLSRSDAPPVAVLPAGPTFTVGFAALAGDDLPSTQQNALVRMLENREGLRVRRLSRRPKLDNPADPPQLTAASIQARQICGDDGLDLLIWGEVGGTGTITLRFAAFGGEEDRPGNFTLGTRLELPQMLQPPLDEFLYACALAACEPKTAPHKELRRRLLPALAAPLQTLGARPPPGVGARQQLAIAICFSHLQAVMAGWPESPQAAKLAVETYRSVLKRLPADDLVEHVAVNRNLAALLLAAADGADEPVPLIQEAVACYRNATQRMSKPLGGQDWAALQYRLAQTLYKLETKTGSTELLKEAIGAYQQALTLYTRLETPQRWAECLHGLAVALQVLGDHLRSGEVLQKAVETSKAVMSVWTREATPAGWALAANTFATALFMLAKHADQWSQLEEAVEVLKDVIAMYEAAGANKQAFVAQKNLVRVEALLKEKRGRPVADPEWWRIGEEDDEPEPSAQQGN